MCVHGRTAKLPIGERCVGRVLRARRGVLERVRPHLGRAGPSGEGTGRSASRAYLCPEPGGVSAWLLRAVTPPVSKTVHQQ